MAIAFAKMFHEPSLNFRQKSIYIKMQLKFSLVLK